MGSSGAKSIRGIKSYFDTTWQNLPPHLSRRMARERVSLPSNGEPKVMHRTERFGELD